MMTKIVSYKKLLADIPIIARQGADGHMQKVSDQDIIQQLERVGVKDPTPEEIAETREAKCQDAAAFTQSAMGAALALIHHLGLVKFTEDRGDENGEKADNSNS